MGIACGLSLRSLPSRTFPNLTDTRDSHRMQLEHAGQRHTLTDTEFVIGSEPACGLVLDSLSPRHASVRKLGTRMATITSLADGADILVNGVSAAREAMPLLHGDTVRLGEHVLKVINPEHPTGGPDTPPVGGRERLHDTLFGVRKETLLRDVPGHGAPNKVEARAMQGGYTGIILAGVISVVAILVLLLT
jgi:predicted component of type VI protein secretion system